MRLFISHIKEMLETQDLGGKSIDIIIEGIKNGTYDPTGDEPNIQGSDFITAYIVQQSQTQDNHEDVSDALKYAAKMLERAAKYLDNYNEQDQ